MERHSIIFVTDQRQLHLSELLSSRRRKVTMEEATSTKFCEEIVATAHRIILPTPVSKLKKTQVAIFRQYFHPEQWVIGGKFDAELEKELQRKQIPYLDFMKEETVAADNADITAEAVVAEVIRRCPYSVEGQKIIITGYGRCAKAAAKRLSALGAKITVLARKKEQRLEARQQGYQAADFAYGPQEAYGTRTFINTVPACVLTGKIFEEMHRDALVLDLASAPGGCDLAAAKKCHIEVIPILGLPGKYTTKSSAKIFADAIDRQCNIKKQGELQWIYQIVPSDMG